MKTRRIVKLITIGAIIDLIAVMSVLSMLFFLRPDESETEKRKLAQFPAFSVSALFSGDYFSDISIWFSDTMPFRDGLIGVNNVIQMLLGTDAPQRGFQEQSADEIPDAAALPPETLPIATTAPPATTAEPPAVTEAPIDTAVPSSPADEGPVPSNVETIGSILVAGNAGYEYYNFSQSAANNYVGAVNAAAARLAGRATVYDMIVPTSMDVVLDTRVREKVSSDNQQKAIGYMESLLLPEVRRVSIFDILTAHRKEYIYYRTDHHWSSLGAYYAYLRFCAVKGAVPCQLNECGLQRFDGFLGTFANKDKALASEPDCVDAYTPPGDYKITIRDKKLNVDEGSMIYDESNAGASLKYGAFIWGDNAYSLIEDKAKPTGESCLLVKESFGNALAPFLAYNYKYLYVIDYRHYTGSICTLVEEKGITDVVFCNNVSMTRSQSLIDQLTARL
ncbi:MAG: hypothetical protein IJL26_00385 [Clostridia bacterium]|nr:hypothetical protein [Clostridia bacterium]